MIETHNYILYIIPFFIGRRKSLYFFYISYDAALKGR